MKKLILVLLMLVSTSAFAKGSSHPPEVVSPSPVKPCFVKLSGNGYYNANYVSYIGKSYRDGYVVITHGKENTNVEVGEGKEQAYIDWAINLINTTCK